MRRLALPALAALLLACGAGARAGYVGGECHPSAVFPASAGDFAIRALQPCGLWRSGAFAPPGGPATAVWVPPCRAFDGTAWLSGVWSGGSCSPDFPGTPSLRAFLAGKRLLFQGDSMVRHLFNRLVFYLREQDVVVDPWFHSHAAYTFNATHDTLDIGDDAARLARAQAPVFEARFAWDPRLEAWSSAEEAQRNWTLVVASPLYWRGDRATHVLADLASLGSVVMITTPLVPDFDAATDAAVRSRNAWIELNARHVPLAAMTQAGVFLRDAEPKAKHFQCQFLSKFGTHNDGTFKAPASGDCRDLLNLNALMMALAHA